MSVYFCSTFEVNEISKFFYSSAGTSADHSLLDSSAGDGLDLERQSPRRSRTPIRRNDDYIVGDKAFEDALQDRGAFEEEDVKPKVRGTSTEVLKLFSC